MLMMRLMWQDPSVLYNAMINPFTRMTIRGVLWYQGEQDVPTPDQYQCWYAQRELWLSVCRIKALGG
jgi:hypothetical protein